VHVDGAGAFGAFKVQVDVIVSSPLKRALQTAQFVGTEMGYEAKVEISKALAPDADLRRLPEMLAKYADREGVLVVGHNPNIFQFLGRWSPATAAPPSACARAPSPASTWTAIRPCCSGSSIRAWPAPSMPAWQKSSRPKTSRK
jgi:phosphohistidine phosphatase